MDHDVIWSSLEELFIIASNFVLEWSDRENQEVHDQPPAQQETDGKKYMYDSCQSESQFGW